MGEEAESEPYLEIKESKAPLAYLPGRIPQGNGVIDGMDLSVE